MTNVLADGLVSRLLIGQKQSQGIFTFTGWKGLGLMKSSSLTWNLSDSTHIPTTNQPTTYFKGLSHENLTGYNLKISQIINYNSQILSFFENKLSMNSRIYNYQIAIILKIEFNLVIIKIVHVHKIAIIIFDNNHT